MSTDNQLYFRQLLSGRDFARGDFIAQQMVNFSYLIGDKASRQAVIVDPAYGIEDLLDRLAEDDMALAGVLVTHYHQDHVGGDLMGHPIEGITDLLKRVDVPIHVQKDEAFGVVRTTGVDDDNLVKHASGDAVEVGSVSIELLHTPGHTPGSQCFLVENRLVAGDTLFLEGCGRTDLPGGDPVAMYESLTQRLAHVPDDAVLFPGHMYAPLPSASMGATRQANYVFRPQSVEQWLMMFGQ